MVEEFELNETKWVLLKQLEHGPLSPKELAELSNTTIANASQQLQLLEAKGFLKKVKRRGNSSRKERDARVLYNLSKQKTWLTTISKDRVEKKELKHPDNYFVNLLLCDLKYIRHVAKFFLENEALSNKIDCLYYLQTIDDEVHFLVVTDELAFFRDEHHSFNVSYSKKNITIKFWSHSLEELKSGLLSKEAYFVDLVRRAVPIRCENDEVKSVLKEWNK